MNRISCDEVEKKTLIHTHPRALGEKSNSALQEFAHFPVFTGQRRLQEKKCTSIA